MFRKKEVYAYDAYAGIKPEKKKPKSCRIEDVPKKKLFQKPEDPPEMYWEEAPKEAAAPPPRVTTYDNESFDLDYEMTSPAKTKRHKQPKPPKQKKERPPKLTSSWTARRKAGIFLIVFALLVSFVAVPAVSNLAAGQTVTVIRAVADIPTGTQIAASHFEAVEMPSKSILRGSNISAESLIGQYAATDIFAGDFILSAKVSAQLPFQDAFLYTLPAGKQAISIVLKAQELGLSGKLLPGDIVSVYASLASQGQDTGYLAIAPLELRYVQLLSLSDAAGNIYEKENAAGELPQTIELLVNDTQAAALAGLNHAGNIHLALACRNNADYAKQLLEEQEAYFIHPGDGATESTASASLTPEVQENE